MTAQMKQPYTQVKSRYEILRQMAREVVHEDLASVMPNKYGAAILKSNISLDGLTFQCLKELRKWEKNGLRRVAWDWDTVQKKYRTHPKRFELSIWHKELFLCSASIGKPTWSGGKLRLDYLESAPQGTPLDGLITDITIAAGVAYARAIGATQLRIMNPVNDKVKAHYLSKPSFSYDQKSNFCYRDLT